MSPVESSLKGITLHYYQFNIGDYRKNTAFLTLVEHGIYRCLIDTYYLDQKPLSLDLSDVMRVHTVRTQEEKDAFKFIIKKFFSKTSLGYTHNKCDQQIQKYRLKSDSARAAANKRWNANA